MCSGPAGSSGSPHPDLLQLLALFDEPLSEQARDYLEGKLARAGFESIQGFALGESDDPELRNMEGRPQSSVADLNEYETMVWQATKPQ